MNSKTNRTRLISLIHAQKNAAHLDEDAYRAVLYGATGNTSCSDCTMSQLRAVFADLNIVLEKQGKKGFAFFSRYEKPGMHNAVLVRAKKLFGTDGLKRLQSFIEVKLRKSSLEQCSEKELRRIMGFLSSVERSRRGHGDKNDARYRNPMSAKRALWRNKMKRKTIAVSTGSLQEEYDGAV